MPKSPPKVVTYYVDVLLFQLLNFKSKQIIWKNKNLLEKHEETKIIKRNLLQYFIEFWWLNLWFLFLLRILNFNLFDLISFLCHVVLENYEILLQVIWIVLMRKTVKNSIIAILLKPLKIEIFHKSWKKNPQNNSISISINFAFPHIWQKIEWKIASQILKLLWIQNLLFVVEDFLAELTIGFFIPTFCSGFWRSQIFWIIFYV